MNLQNNTPPDGDFVRYVERLTASQALSAASPATTATPPVAVADMRPPSDRGNAKHALPSALWPATAKAVGLALVAVLVALNLLFGLPGMVISAVILGLGWVAWRGWRIWLNAGGLLGQLAARAREFEKATGKKTR